VAVTAPGILAADGAFEAAVAALAECRRLIPPGLADVSQAYLEGARGALLNARDEFVHATTRDTGQRWRARIAGVDAFQAAGSGERLSDTEFLLGVEDIGETRPDLGADLMCSDVLASMTMSPVFSGLLASALADHAWMHLPSASTWMASWPAAEALVRARSGGRWFPRLHARELRGTVDRKVAQELATLGWRRLEAPRHMNGPGAVT